MLRNRDDGMSARPQGLVHFGDNAHVVADMFEHVESADRVEESREGDVPRVHLEQPGTWGALRCERKSFDEDLAAPAGQLREAAGNRRQHVACATPDLKVALCVAAESLERI